MTPRGLRIVGVACVAAGVFDVAIVDAHLIQRWSLDEGGQPKVDVAMNASPPSPPPSPPPSASDSRPTPTTSAPVAAVAEAVATSLPDNAPKLPLNTIRQFQVDQATSADARAIATLGAWLRATPTAAIVLEGHTDQRGEAQYNERLSLRRARWVHDQLIANGAKTEQIRLVALGSSRPLVTGSDEESFSQNRRVDVKLDDSATTRPVPR